MFWLREYQGVPFKPPNETLSWNQNSFFFSWGEVAATRAGKPQPHVPLWPLSQSWRRKKQREASKKALLCSGLLPVLTSGEPQSRYMSRKSQEWPVCSWLVVLLLQLRKASPSFGATNRSNRSLLKPPMSPLLQNKVLAWFFISSWNHWTYLS